MAKRKSKDKPKAAGGKAPVLKRRSLPNWPVLGLAAAGMLLAGYLTATTWLEATPAYCTEGSGCDLVQNSRWGYFLGLPMAFWGFLAYGTLATIALRVKDGALHWRLAWLVSFTGLGVSVYLTAISFLVLQATCFYCLISLGLMTALFVVVALQRPEGLAGFSWPSWAGQTALLVAIVVAGLHLHYSGIFDPSAGPEDPYLKGLAEHISRSGAVFYGAYW